MSEFVILCLAAFFSQWAVPATPDPLMTEQLATLDRQFLALNGGWKAFVDALEVFTATAVKSKFSEVQIRALELLAYQVRPHASYNAVVNTFAIEAVAKIAAESPSRSVQWMALKVLRERVGPTRLMEYKALVAALKKIETESTFADVRQEARERHETVTRAGFSDARRPRGAPPSH